MSDVFIICMNYEEYNQSDNQKLIFFGLIVIALIDKFTSFCGHPSVNGL